MDLSILLISILVGAESISALVGADLNGADMESAPTVLTDMDGAGVGAESISALISNGADMNGADMDLDWGGYRIRPYGFDGYEWGPRWGRIHFCPCWGRIHFCPYIKWGRYGFGLGRI